MRQNIDIKPIWILVESILIRKSQDIEFLPKNI